MSYEQLDELRQTPKASDLDYPDADLAVTVNPTTEVVRFYRGAELDKRIVADADDVVMELDEMR